MKKVKSTFVDMMVIYFGHKGAPYNGANQPTEYKVDNPEGLRTHVISSPEMREGKPHVLLAGLGFWCPVESLYESN